MRKKTGPIFFRNQKNYELIKASSA